MGYHMSDDTRGGLSRRDLIKRGAIIGGVAWSAPIVQGIASPAFAADGSPGGGECTDYFQFKADWNGSGFDFDTDQNANLPKCEGEEPAGWGTYPDGSNKIVLTPVVVDGELRSVVVSDNPAAPECEVLILTIKGGSDRSPNGYCETATIAPDSSSATVTAPAGGAAISYVAGIICCEPPA